MGRLLRGRKSNAMTTIIRGFMIMMGYGYIIPSTNVLNFHGKPWIIYL
jgi:hypothetical protein